jgi:hypothetical protein
MAEHVQGTPEKNTQGESKLEGPWWKTPTVTAAIIAGIAAIIVGIIGLAKPKSKPLEPTKIEQHTYGPGSPAIGVTGGNVTIHPQPSEQKP